MRRSGAVGIHWSIQPCCQFHARVWASGRQAFPDAHLYEDSDPYRDLPVVDRVCSLLVEYFGTDEARLVVKRFQQLLA